MAPQETIRDSIFWVELDRIKPNPYQPRREFDQLRLQELADSIRMYGLLQPLTVTRTEIPLEDGGLRVEYELIAGERRLRASKLAGLAQIPVIIRTGEESDLLKLELAIIENLQREDLNPVDRARAFDRLNKEFKFTLTEIGRKLGRSREYVSNTVRLLQLPEHVLTYVAEGKLTEGHTRPLLMLGNRPDEQRTLAEEIVLKKLTVRETEAVARRIAQDKVTERYKINPEILALERQLTEHLGTRVQIEPRPVGGRVVISYFSAEELGTLLASLRLEEEAQLESDVFAGDALAVTQEDNRSGLVEELLADTVPLEIATVDDAILSDDLSEVFSPEAVPQTDERMFLAADGTLSEPIESVDESVITDVVKSDVGGYTAENVDVMDVPAPVLVDNVLVEDTVLNEVAEVMQERVLAENRPIHEEVVPLSFSTRDEMALLDDRSKDERSEDEDLYTVRNFSI